ncbi:MAG TPA: hypothetical protein VMT15_04945 [Bryobacteraceae bacterium]|nr:hypothetical protein [Bryobacteraceae bacterium]
MKKLILASILCLAFATILRAQAPVQPPNVGVWHVVQNIQSGHPHALLAPISVTVPKIVELTTPPGLCSVPLLEAHVDANDPGIAAKPKNQDVKMPQARVPAPPCPKP